MKKTSLLIFVLMCFLSYNAKAQFVAGATLGLQVPVGDFGDGAKAGVGINLSGHYMLKENMAVGLNIGFNRFGGQDFGFGDEDYNYSYSMIPVTGLFEYHFSAGSIKPYAGLELGLYNFGYRVKYGGEVERDGESYFGLAPAAGVLYNINENLILCANLKLNNVFAEGDNLTWIGINAGVRIPF